MPLIAVLQSDNMSGCKRQPRMGERYDRGLDDIFKVQDQVTRVIANTRSSQVDKDISNRAARKHTDSFVAYESARPVLHH